MNLIMQGKEGLREKTFYLYDYTNLLVRRTKKIYSPYNEKSFGRVPSEDHYKNPDSVEFIKGQYTAKEEFLGKKKFEQQVEWLGFYNARGGQLKKGTAEQNGKYYKNDGIHIVKEEIIKIEKTNTVTVEKKVEIQQIPKTVAELMNPKQLEELAISWGVKLSDNLDNIRDVDTLRSNIIETLKQAGHIS